MYRIYTIRISTGIGIPGQSITCMGKQQQCISAIQKYTGHIHRERYKRNAQKHVGNRLETQKEVQDIYIYVYIYIQIFEYVYIYIQIDISYTSLCVSNLFPTCFYTFLLYLSLCICPVHFYIALMHCYCFPIISFRLSRYSNACRDAYCINAIHIYIYIHINFLCISLSLYIYRQREIERQRERERQRNRKGTELNFIASTYKQRHIGIPWEIFGSYTKTDVGITLILSLSLSLYIYMYRSHTGSLQKHTGNIYIYAIYRTYNNTK